MPLGQLTSAEIIAQHSIGRILPINADSTAEEFGYQPQ
jgi:hypothetical protein